MRTEPVDRKAVEEGIVSYEDNVGAYTAEGRSICWEANLLLDEDMAN
jgi:hypothetical protein